MNNMPARCRVVILAGSFLLGWGYVEEQRIDPMTCVLVVAGAGWDHIRGLDNFEVHKAHGWEKVGADVIAYLQDHQRRVFRA